MGFGDDRAGKVQQDRGMAFVRQLHAHDETALRGDPQGNGRAATAGAALAVLYLLQQTARDQIRGDGGHRPGADVELARHIHARHLPVRADLFKHLLAQRACIILRQGQQRATA